MTGRRAARRSSSTVAATARSLGSSSLRPSRATRACAGFTWGGRALRFAAVPTGFAAVPTGDVQRVEVSIDASAAGTQLKLANDDGTEACARAEPSEPGARSEGLRILRNRAEARELHLLLEGRARQSCELRVRTPRTLGPLAGVEASRVGPRDLRLRVPLKAKATATGAASSPSPLR